MIMFWKNARNRKTLKLRVLTFALLVSLSAMQPREAYAQQVVIDPTAAAHWVTSNAQWLAKVALDKAQWIINNILLSSGFSSITNGLEVLERAEERMFQFVGDMVTRSTEVGQNLNLGVEATPSPTSPACSTVYGNRARNENGYAMGKLVAAVTSVVAAGGRIPNKVNGKIVAPVATGIGVETEQDCANAPFFATVSNNLNCPP